MIVAFRTEHLQLLWMGSSSSKARLSYTWVGSTVAWRELCKVEEDSGEVVRVPAHRAILGAASRAEAQGCAQMDSLFTNMLIHVACCGLYCGSTPLLQNDGSDFIIVELWTLRGFSMLMPQMFQ